MARPLLAGKTFHLVFPCFFQPVSYTVDMKALTQAALVAVLAEVKGATFATLITETDSRCRKTGNPYGNVRKVSRVNVTLGFQYAAAVNRQRTREGAEADFEAAPRQWGVRLPGTMLVEHKGKQYLETKVERSLGHQYFSETGQALTDAQVAPFLPVRSGPGRQDVEKEIMVRDYSLDSIRSLAFKGEQYVMLQDVPASIAGCILAPVTVG